ncbi:hypothetical protein HAX54_015469, partial [Datura stramonium]|nr:hypothetical protein [Datura stramonium]
TGDVVATLEEIKEENLEIDNISLDMENVEMEPEETMSEIIYANGDHCGESIEGDVVEVKVSSHSSAISKAISNSEK